MTWGKPVLLGGEGTVEHELPWITPTFALESFLSSLKKNESADRFSSRGHGHYLGQALFGVFPDTKIETAESSHIWPSTSLCFKGTAWGGWVGGAHGAALWPPQGWLRGAGVRLKGQRDGAPLPPSTRTRVTKNMREREHVSWLRHVTPCAWTAASDL